VDFPQVFITKELGDAALVRQAIENALPGVRWRDGRGSVDVPPATNADIVLWRDGAGAIEHGAVDRVTVTIHDDGDPMSILDPLCRMHGWTACDSALALIDCGSSIRHIWSAPVRST